NNHETCLPIIKNSIVWGNGDSNITGNIDEASSHNIIEGMDGHSPDTDPLFTDNYGLRMSSPAINAGSNETYEEAGGDLAHGVDLAGNPRVYKYSNGGQSIDLGAYEYQGYLVPAVRYVKATNDGGINYNDGYSWESASSDLQAMVDELADAGGGEVWVAKGTYIAPGETVAEGGFVMRNGVAIYGGFSGNETTVEARN